VIVLIACFGVLLLKDEIWPPDPVVTLDIVYYSPTGDTEAVVAGTVTVSRGNPEDYVVTMALVSPSDGRMYAPKPSSAHPSVPVTPSDTVGVGNFTCVFAASTSPDIFASELFVYVVPKSFVPSVEVESTIAEALDSKTIIRE